MPKTRLQPRDRNRERARPARPARAFLWFALIGLIALFLGSAAYWAIRSTGPGPQALWERARENLKSNRLDLAEKDLARLGQLRAPTPLDWFLKAQLAFARSQPDAALAELKRVPDAHYMAAQARLLAGQIERQRDRLRFAEQALREAVGLDPALVQAHRELIYIYGMQERRPEINREFLTLQKLAPLTYEDVYRWTSLLNNSWEPGDVVGDLIRFVAADPLDRWSRLALAGIFRRMGLHEQADSTLESLPAEDPEANAIRVQIALDRQDNSKAEQLLALGRSEDPNLARLRGRQALARRDAPSAVRHLRIAYAADPQEHETLFGLSTALELLGDEKQARSIRETAQDLDRLNTLLQRAAAAKDRPSQDLIREIGNACAALHRDGEARAWFEVAIARNSLDSEAQKALFQLKNRGRIDTPSQTDALDPPKKPPEPPAHLPART
jgi:tetratricopeptide (TPR) repeat protein